MENKKSDIFESTKANVFERKAAKSNNFFLSEPIDELTSHEPARRLNDYDFNLLKEEAYKDIDDDLFKLEYKISKTEEEIKKLDEQIKLVKEVGNFGAVSEIEKQKSIAQSDYDALVEMYNGRSLSAKITDTVSNSVKTQFNFINKNISGFSEKIISKLPKKLAKIFEIKKSLAKLENINKSVDELMSLNIPYGENIDKYTQLSKYIIKANSIHAEISKYI